MQEDSSFTVIRIYHGEGEDRRLYAYAAAATEIEFSISLDGVDYDECLTRICIVIPALIRVDVVFMENADGNLSLSVDPKDRATILQFRKWAAHHDLQSLSDLLSSD